MIPGSLASRVRQTGGIVTTDFAIALTVVNGEIVRFQMLEDRFGSKDVQICPALRDEQIGVSAVNNCGIAIMSVDRFPINSGGYGTMLHDGDFAALTGEHSTCEIRIQLGPGNGYWGRSDTHLNRLLPPVWMIAGPGSRNDFSRSDSVNSKLCRVAERHRFERKPELIRRRMRQPPRKRASSDGLHEFARPLRAGGKLRSPRIPAPEQASDGFVDPGHKTQIDNESPVSHDGRGNNALVGLCWRFSSSRRQAPCKAGPRSITH